MRQNLPTTEMRIARLEGQNRRLRLAFGGLLALAAAALLAGQAAPDRVDDVLRARRIEIVGDNGTSLITMEPYRFGGRITTRTHEGATLCHLGGNGRGDGTLAVYGGDVQHGLVLLTGDTHGGFVSVISRTGQMACGAGVDKTHGGVMTVRSPKGDHKAFWMGP